MQRTIIRFLSALLLASAPSLAVGQSPASPPRVGFLMVGGVETTGQLRSAFLGGLRNLGYVDGQNIVVDFRYAQGDVSRFPTLADDLVRQKAEIILTASTPALVAAKAAAGTTPIVFATLGEPVARQFVASQARPGGNITGLTIFTHELAGKRLELLQEMLPRVQRVAVLQIPGNQPVSFEARGIVTVAEAAGLTTKVFDAASPGEFGRAFDEIALWRADAVLLAAEAMFNSSRRQLLEAASRHSLALACPYPEMAEAGCLFSYGIDLLDNFRRAAGYVDKILKGANPGELPVENPTKFQTFINLKTAKALGLSIPTPLLVRSDKLFE